MPRRTTARPHRRRRWLVAVAVALILLGGGGALAWGLTRGSTTPAATERTVTVSKQTVKETVSASGTVEPARRADLTFGAGGTVTSVDVAVGDTVDKGDVLARLDDDDLQADVDAAEADLEAAEDALTTAEDDSDTTTAELNAAKAKVAVDKSARSSAKTALEGATLRATFAGTVAEVDVAKGDPVGSSGSSGSSGSGSSGSASSGTGASGSGSTGSSSTSGTAVTVISTNRFSVDTSVGSADLAKLKKGLQAQITTSGSTTAVFGTVSSIAVMASTSSASGTGSGTSGGSATFPVTIDVTGTRKDLYAGATATVSIIVSQRDDVLSVPTLAISTANGQAVVTKLVGADRVVTPVTLGTSYGATTEVTAGLADGDQVVVTLPGRTAGGTASGRSSAGTGGGRGGYGGFGGGGTGGGAGGGQGGQNQPGQNQGGPTQGTGGGTR